MSTAGDAQRSRGPKGAAPHGMREADSPPMRDTLLPHGGRE
jgi:hypothetical protein